MQTTHQPITLGRPFQRQQRRFGNGWSFSLHYGVKRPDFDDPVHIQAGHSPSRTINPMCRRKLIGYFSPWSSPMQADTPVTLPLLATHQLLLQESELPCTTSCSVDRNWHSEAHQAPHAKHNALNTILLSQAVSSWLAPPNHKDLSILTAHATGYFQSHQLDCPTTKSTCTMCWTEERLGERGQTQLVLYRGFYKKVLFCQFVTCSTWWMNGAPHTPPGSGRWKAAPAGPPQPLHCW